ncbi:MAG: vWA domain-containing protein, partial [Desulfobacterales bacterium]
MMIRREISYTKFARIIILMGCVLLCWTDAVPAQQCKPLLLPGKKTLFQRVISHPGATLYKAPDASGPILQFAVTPFTVLYVYKRDTVDGMKWVNVGPSSNCKPIGWIKSSKVSDWRQSLTLRFTERVGRNPVLFFKDLDSLEKVAGSQSPGDRAGQLTSEFGAIKSGDNSVSEDFPILAMEPPEEAVSRQRFYLMPIFQTVELFEGVKFLEVASIDPGSGDLQEISDLRTAIVFVIDTTISMKPYIERTRQVVNKIYDAIAEEGLAEQVAFGLVAFRSNIERTPDLEYVSKVISDVRDERDRTGFEHALADT